MKGLSIFFKPISENVLANIKHESQAGNKIDVFIGTDFPNYTQAKLAIVGIVDKEEVELGLLAADAVREQFYSLYTKADYSTLVDLGNLYPGETEKDTAYALTEVISELVKRKVIPIIIGSNVANTFYQYKAYERLEQLVNLVSISGKVSIGNHEEALASHNYVGHIIVQKPNVLFNYCNIGYQTYLNSPENIDLLDKLYFDSLRLGEAQSDVKKAEPFIRYADIVSVDLSSVRFSELSAAINNQPNGWYGEEICQLARYAGMSDKLTSFSLWGYSPLKDVSQVSASLIGQILWCFIDGYLNRKHDFPSDSKEDYIKYRVSLEQGQHELIFYKSEKTNRWWIEVPYPPDQKFRFQRHQLVPCSYEDYLNATQNNMPDVWWRAYQKLF
ncbi:MAG: formimidoylglutamase [Flavobacteriales bacterium]